MLTNAQSRICCLCLVVATAVSGCFLSQSADGPHATTPAASTCRAAGENPEQWHIAAPRSPEAPEIWVPALPGWEQSRAIDDPDFVLTLANKRLLGVVQVVTSDVTNDANTSPQAALDDFMRGMRNKSQAADGFDPSPAQVCGLTAQRVTYTTRSPDGTLSITALAVAVPNGPNMHVVALLVEGYEPRSSQFHSDAEQFLREWKVIQPGR